MVALWPFAGPSVRINGPQCIHTAIFGSGYHNDSEVKSQENVAYGPKHFRTPALEDFVISEV